MPQVLYRHSILILAAVGCNVHGAAPSRLAAITDNRSEAGYQHVHKHQWKFISCTEALGQCHSHERTIFKGNCSYLGQCNYICLLNRCSNTYKTSLHYHHSERLFSQVWINLLGWWFHRDMLYTSPSAPSISSGNKSLYI